MKNEGKIEISVQPKEISPEASKQAYEFRQLVKQAGFLELDAVTRGEIGWFLPQGFNGEQLTTALNLYSLGVNSQALESKIDSSEKILSSLSETQQQSLYAIPYLIAAFEEYDPERSSQLQVTYAPSITIQQVPPTAVSQNNSFVFEKLEGYFSPVMKQIAGKGIGLAKKKLKEFAVNAIEKGGKKLIKQAFKKGAGLAIKAGAKAAITAGAQAIGTTVPILGNIVAFIATEVIPRLIKGVTKLSSAFLRILTGEKDRRKQVRNIAIGVFVLAIALGQPVLAGVAGFTALGAQAAVLGGQGISAGIAGAGQSIVYGLYAVAAPAIGVPILVALIITPLLIAFIFFVINSGAYIVPPGPPSVSALVENPYIGVEKLAKEAGSSADGVSFLEYDNSNLPVSIEYTITVTAKRATLSNIVFDMNCTVISNSGQTCPAHGNVTVNGQAASLPPTPPSFISPADSYVITYTMLYRSGQFEDTLTIDTFTVSADIESEGVVQTQAAASASIKIGNPPDQCPSTSLWPVRPEGSESSINIYQGAYTGTGWSHRALEALDISTTVGHTVYATHTGIARVLWSSCLGNHIEILSTCGNNQFFSRYAHLEGTSVSTGEAVTMGDVIGVTGNTGGSNCTSGPHLHYGFRYPVGVLSVAAGPPTSNPPFMTRPYTPVDVSRGCIDEVPSRVCSQVVQ